MIFDQFLMKNTPPKGGVFEILRNFMKNDEK